VTLETVLAAAAATPGIYGFVCWIRRGTNARRAARWAKETHPDDWSALHWLARRNAWAGVEVLIAQKKIAGPEVDGFRARDGYLEKAAWIGLLISAVLLLVIVVSEAAGDLIGWAL
jgi:hypothetical protein